MTPSISASSAQDPSGPLLPMAGAVVALPILAALVPGVVTLLAAVLAVVALLGVLLAVMRRLLADGGRRGRERSSPRPP